MFLNKVIIYGNLTRDPERRSLPSGMTVVSMGVATNRVFVSQGQKQQETEFHNVIVFGKQAEIAAQYLKRGSTVLVEGHLKTRNWQDQQGVKHYRTEIIADRIQLGPRGASTFSQNNYPAQNPNTTKPLNTAEQDIPVIEETTPAPNDTINPSIIDPENEEEIDIKDIPF